MNLKGKLEFIQEEVSSHLKLVKKSFTENTLEKIIMVAGLIVKCIKNGGKILLCGNGGSCADCQHFAGEMVNKFKKNRNPLPFISLTTDTSIITSIGNDFSFEEIFSKQIKAIGRKGDILICFSTSGESKNIIEAAKEAKLKKITVISLTGNTPNTLEKFSDFVISVPSKETYKIQQVHLIIYHLLCSLIENEF